MEKKTAPHFLQVIGHKHIPFAPVEFSLTYGRISVLQKKGQPNCLQISEIMESLKESDMGF